MSNIDDFVILKKGTLKKYKGSGGDVVVPDGVTSIGDRAFWYCSGLTSVIIPEGVTSIGEEAFYDCKGLTSVIIPEGMTSIGEKAFYDCERLTNVTIPDSLKNIGSGAFSGCKSLADENGFVIVNGFLYNYFGSGGNVIIPEGVKAIGDSVFSGCEGLTSITIPESVTSIGDHAFSGCSSLTCFEMNNCNAKLVNNVFQYGFSNRLPEGLIPQIQTLYPHMADGALKQYVLNNEIWKCLSSEVQTEIFLARQGKALEKAYMQCIDSKQLEPLGKAVLERLNSTKPTAKECNAAAAYMTMFHEKAPTTILNQLYAKLKECKNGAKALKTVESHVALMEKLGSEVKADDSLSPVSQKIMTMMIAEKKNVKDVEKALKNFYSLTIKDLPVLKTTDGKELEPFASAWILTTHEKLYEQQWEQPYVIADYKKEGLRPEAAEIVAMLDQKSLQAALLKLADDNLGLSGRSKKMFLAYPICRYADEDLMTELTKRASKWRSTVSGNDAPPLATFRKAVWYSDTRAAMFFAERYNELDEYAAVRSMTEDDIRDKYLSDVGLYEKGGKEYDLGNQIVTVRLQKDLSFIVELPNGKTAKSLPKKGADAEKYEAAKKDFAEMKKSVKMILKNRGKVLFENFLSGKKRSAEDWQGSYLNNPLLREAASLVVWTQGKETFVLKDGAPVNSAEQPYTITDKPILVAHPMEMKEADTKAWQKYFTAHGLKQPFAQVWEPVRKAEDIKEDRYKDCMIPYYRFLNQEKHGITVEDYDFHNEIYINIDECDTGIERIDWHRHEINPDDRFEVQSFKFKKYSRQVNHIVAYLDRVTVWDRVRKDDLSVMDMIDGFTLAQITDFIAAAQEANANNVLAALLEYKNNNFSDFDPMDEFTLEW